MDALLRLSEGIDAALRWIGRISCWLLLGLAAVICFDVVSRKLGFQIPGFGSTKLQELEWHGHAALFSLWLGYAYVRNAHVRIDVATGPRTARTKAWIELLGVLVFALPYCFITVYFGYDFAERSFLQNESSDAPTGLPYRWIIKGVLFIGLVLLLSAVLSVAARTLAYLFGSPAVRTRAAPAYLGNGH